MKKTEYIVFVVMCMVLCLIPFAGMSVAKSDETTENRTLMEAPEWKKDGKWNREYFTEWGEYFEDHFAFRSLFVGTDSLIQSHVFQVSNTDTVIRGEDGWLYYSATLSDYKGENLMSERAVYNAGHNISIIQKYVEEKGGKFLLTIAPNKNSLYEEHMPYYLDKKVSDNKNIELLEITLEEKNVPYADLFEVFEADENIYYMKKDSHWNNQGAVMAYHAMMNALDKEHETYETVNVSRTKTAEGDLGRMLYPYGGEADWELNYDYEASYQYVTETESVEDAWIETQNEKKEGTVLMYRDSFGNTLLPFVAQEYEKAYFSKAIPYAVEKDVDKCQPDTVIIECVERNVKQFATEAAVITGPVCEIKQVEDKGKTKTTIAAGVSELDGDYLEIGGYVDEEYIEKNENIYVSVTVDGEKNNYEALLISDDTSDYGYRVYLPVIHLDGRDAEVSVLVGNSDKATVVARETVHVSAQEM